MFWKKNDKSTVSFSFPNEDECQRTSFRVAPDDGSPVHVRFGAAKTRVLNISAGGLAFENHDFSEGESHDIVLSLPGEYVDVRCNVTILRMDSTGKICFSTFSSLSPEGLDIIHHYVLVHQKQNIQKNKAQPVYSSELAVLAKNLSEGSGSDA